MPKQVCIELMSISNLWYVITTWRPGFLKARCSIFDKEVDDVERSPKFVSCRKRRCQWNLGVKWQSISYCFLRYFFKVVAMEEFASRKARIDSYENMYLPSINRESILVPSMIQCSHKCVASSTPCIGANFKATSTQLGYECEMVYLADTTAGIEARESWIYMANNLMVWNFSYLLKAYMHAGL